MFSYFIPFFFASVSSTAGLFLFIWSLATIDVFDWYAIRYVHFRLYLKKNNDQTIIRLYFITRIKI